MAEIDRSFEKRLQARKQVQEIERANRYLDEQGLRSLSVGEKEKLLPLLEQPPKEAKKGIPSLLRKLGRRLPIGLLIDLLQSATPSQEEMVDRIKRVEEESKTGLDHILDFISDKGDDGGDGGGGYEDPSEPDPEEPVIITKKLPSTEKEFFEDMLSEGDPYDFKLSVPSAKINIDSRGNTYLEIDEKDVTNLFNYVNTDYFDHMSSKDIPPSMKRYPDWTSKLKPKDTDNNFKTGGVIRNSSGDYSPRAI